MRLVQNFGVAKTRTKGSWAASEPWVFLVGSDGRIQAKFEGPISVRELAAAVRRLS